MGARGLMVLVLLLGNAPLALAHSRPMRVLVKNAPGNLLPSTLRFLAATTTYSEADDTITLAGTSGEQLTFTRSSARTCLTADGSTVLIAANKPCLSLAYGGSVTTAPGPWNFILQSDAMDSSTWSKASATVTAGFTDPDGGLTADRVVYTAGTTRSLYQAFGALPSTAYTVAVWGKADAPTTVCLSRTNNVDWTASEGVAIDLTTTWTRFTLSYTTGASDNASRINIGSSEAASPPAGCVASLAASTIYLAKAQVNAGASALAADYFATATVPTRRPGAGTAASMRVDVAGTNRALRNEELETAPWASTGTVTVSTDAYPAPSGAVAMEKLSLTDNAANYRTQAITGLTSGTGKTISAWVRADSGTAVQSVALECGTGTRTACACTRPEDFGVCNTATSGNVCIAYATVGTTPVRLAAQLTCSTSGTTATAYLSPGQLLANAGAVVGGFWGVQVENTLFATPYVGLTQGTSVARTVESANFPGTWALGTTPCLAATVSLTNVVPQSIPVSAWNSSLNFMAQYKSASADLIRFQYTPNSQLVDHAIVLTPGTSYAFLAKVVLTSFYSCIDGACTSAVKSIGGESTFANLYIGSQSGVTPFNGALREVRASHTLTGCQ